jgi:NodT family efflux transporter outer membrane factor (OMF) lipoprotein
MTLDSRAPDFRGRRCCRLLATASLIALLAGCTVGPDFKSPNAPDVNGFTEDGIPKAQVPNAQEEQQRFVLGKKISGDWWDLFHDKRLNDIVQQAIVGNQTIAQAHATLAQAQQAIVQAGGVLYPQVDLGAGFTRQQVSEGQLGLPGKTHPFNLYSLGPTVSYSLDPFGGNRRRVEQEGALAEYQRYQLNAAYLTITGNAVTEALNIASAREQIKAVEQIIADDEENLRLVQTELKAGEATQLDVETQSSQLEADRTLLPPIVQQVSVARHALSILLGRLPAQWVPPDFDLSEFTLPPELPVTLPSNLVRQRPDILASEAQLHAASAAVGVATAQLYPNINLSATFTQEALTTNVLFNPESSVWSVGAQLLAPVFHGGALIAQKRGAVDAFDAALANYKQTVLTGFGQVADVMQALVHDAQELEAQRRALASAEESLRLTRTTYQYGNVGVLQVLEAQRLSEQARLGYVRAKAQRYLDTVQFLTAMGGGWWNWKDTAKPIEAKDHVPPEEAAAEKTSAQ